MKKTIYGISGLIVLIFIFILTVDAQNADRHNKKTATITQGAPAVKCCNATDSKTMSDGPVCSKMKSDPAPCQQSKCDPAACKAGKCDPAACKAGKCDPATCKTSCTTMTATMKCNPANCTK